MSDQRQFRVIVLGQILVAVALVAWAWVMR
jgi:hypothetical protein